MSLWSKPAAQITFADVDEFCKTMQPEGARLDYKGVNFPKDLAKTIAAFANTLGGLIILGVDADKNSNTPIWPPTDGIPMAAGLSERVIQVAQDAIYPPVRVDVSNVIENDLLPKHAIVVIRVAESRAAPHATQKNTRVYVYERTGNKNEPYELADIDRIEHLLNRRRRMVDQREAELQENLSRGSRVMHPSICPIRWISASPVYPWRNIHDQYDCKRFHQMQALGLFNGHPTYQTVPSGSFSIVRQQDRTGALIAVACSSVSANGTLFGMTYTEETIHQNDTLFGPHEAEKPGKMWVNMRNCREMIGVFLESCHQFYKRSKEPPGQIMLSFGVKNAKGVMMHDSQSAQKSDAPFPDPEYRIDTVLESEDMGIRMPMLEELYGDIIFAFNANAIPS